MDRSELLNDVEQAQRLLLDDRQASMWTAMPGIVQSVDFDAMTCEVQPSIQGQIQDETGTIQNVNYPLLVDVPIVFPSAGGFLITFPIATGDEVLVIFASRAIDSWWQSGGTANRPVEARMHDLSDGFAIPGPRSQVKLPSGAINTTNLQIRNDAGTAVIELTAAGKVTITASEVDITGNLKVTGTIMATGEITGTTGATPIPLSTHVHTSAAPGSPTGPALP